MDGMHFDDLTRVVAQASSRRAALGLVAGSALAAALAKLDLTDAKKGNGKNKKKKKCRKLNQSCGGKKKKCCKGLTCTDGACLAPVEPECDSNDDCGANEICQNGVCVPEPPECVNDNDCGNNEICDDGECVPEPECDSDNDCGDNEACQNGTCNCPEIEDGRCIRRCEVQNDCPGVSSCRNLSPDASPSIEDGVCVDEAFFLCDTTPCTDNNNCASDEVCVMMGCGVGTEQVGRCQEFSVFS